MKTIGEWLDELPEGWKLDAENTELCVSDIKVPSLEQAVLVCTEWNKTQAGYDSWHDLFLSVKVGVKNLPSHPCIGKVQLARIGKTRNEGEI